MSLAYVFLRNFLSVLKTMSYWKVFLSYFVFYLGRRHYRFHKTQGSQFDTPSFTYGETPYYLWDLMALYFKPKDKVMDLGCGRGNGLMYAAKKYPILCLGIEAIEPFTLIGSQIAKLCGVGNIQFMHKDLSLYKLPKADVVYLAGTCFSDELLETLAFELLKIKPRLIFSISTSLEEYGLSGYETSEFFIVMPWGRTTLFKMELKPS